MPSPHSLAAVLRTVRAARGLSQEQMVKTLEARHLHNVEHGLTNMTLKMLEGISGHLEVDPIALLAAASSFDRHETFEEFMAYLWSELGKLRAMRVMENVPSQFSDGVLIAAKGGKPATSADKIRAVLDCKAEGLTQKETSVRLGIPKSTVHKIWHMPPEEQ